MNEMYLNQLYKDFTSLQQSNLQLDIFRENGQVLGQFYRFSDVKKWDLGIDFGNCDGFVLEISFHKSKTKNSENLARFQEHNMYQEFRKFDQLEENSYFRFITKEEGEASIQQIISELIADIYIDAKPRIELNAY